MALSDVYKGLEDKYYAFMDSLDAKGIPVYKVIDPIENAGIPSFPVFILLILIILGAIGFFIFGIISGGTETTNISIIVTDSDDTPIDGARVEIIGKETQTTNFEGIVNVSNVKINDSLSVTVTKEGFNELNRTLSVTEKEQVFPLILAAEGENSISVEFRKQGTNELITDSLSVEFSCSDNFTFSATQTITDGVADVAIPNDCGTLYANLTNFSCENRCAVDLESGNLVFYLNEPTAEEIGKINVTIMDEQDNLLAGIEVIARQENDYFDYETCDTTTLGTCSLEGLPFGKYYLVANDQTGKLARFISESLVPPQFVELKQDQPQFDYTITMLESINTKKILLKISNQLGEPVKDAEATLFKELDRIDSKFSGADGIVEFSVTETGTFNVSVEHPSYLKKSVESLTPGQENIISLVPITQENVNRIPVAVVDEKAKPVENARIYLRNSSSLANIGDYIVSGADGKAQFERVEEASYVVFAEKSGFEAKSSGIIIVKNGVPVNEVRIALNIGFGSIKLIVKNEDDSAVSGATIRVIDYCNNSVLEDLAANTSPDGTKTIEVRVDKCVYFEVSATGYLNYSTNIIQPVKGVTIEKSIVLVRSVDSLKSSFVLYSGTNIVSGTSLERGKQYTAKISLLIPEGTSFDEAGVHFRTGAASEATTNAMEKDSIYISSVALGSGKLLKGTSFTPLKGYDTDAKKLTTGNAKWFNASFTKPKAGVYEIIANIQVTQNASSGALLDVYTRAWGRQGTSYSRNPIDGVLGSSESNSQKQVLYANAARNVYTIGNSSLCNEGFCYTFTLTDKSTNLTQGIIDSVPAKIANDYSLNFSLINNSSQTDAAEISVAHNSNGLKLSQYEITDVDSRKLNGTITANKLAVPVGDMLKGATVLGRIDFTTMKEGINNLEFKLNSQTAGGKQTVFSKIFKLEIPPSQSMTLEVLPQVIVPFIENELMIKISNETGSPIEEATVSIKKNNEKIVSGKTNSEGIFSFSLESVREGTIIEISAEKAGYRKQIKTINVQQEIISVNPSSINETIKANIEQTVKRDVQLRNLTDIPLKIGLLDLTTDFDGLVELDFDKDYVGREIVKEVDDNIMLSLKLSPKGKNVTKVTTTNAVLNIHFVSDELQRTWVSSIPIAITIGLGNEADFANCLELDQEAVSIASAGESVQKNILLSNKCTVNGNPIDLKNIEARVKQGAANKIGELVLRSSIEEDTLNLAEESIEFASNITLTEKFKTIASGIGKDKESALTLTFNPDKLDSATSTYTLELRAHNPTAKGDQIILTKTTLNLTVNDLLACVKVIQRAPLQLQLSPFNAGFGQYQNQFGYNPAQGFGAFSSSTDPSYGSLFNNPNVVFPNQGTGNYNNYYQSLQYRNNPSSLFNPQFGATGYTDPRFNNQFSSNIANSEGKFNVENSCTLPMEIRIITDPALVTEPTGMDLTPNQNQDVKVKSTYLIGTYKIEVKAKAKGSSDKQVTVEKLQATIEPNDSYRNWRDCISLDKKVFQFNDFLAKPTEGVITNTCYSSGVILDPSNPIEFDVFNAYTGTPDNVFIDNLVQRTEIVDRTVKPSADGKVIEQVRFRLRKSLEYRTSIPETQRPSETNPLIELYNLRVTFNRGYYTVRAPQSAYINFRTRTGNTQRQIYDVIIEDLWEIPGVLPPITIEDQLGTDSANYDCINAIDWSNDFPNGIPSTRFKNGIFEWTADPSVMIIDRDHCGTADHLKNLQKSLTDSDSGLIISFSLTDNDHNVKLKFDNRNMKQDASIDTSIDADLYRFRLSRSKPATIAVRGTIKSPVIAPQGAKEEARKGIEQGKSA
ncbi:MAG: carboxypeptidase-like regulatory domain-containing protein, partial [archaeon]|nr:carboxypeptidase-like regulatory domain-containing protein [archaeon]